jgi:hypothetical protein
MVRQVGYLQGEKNNFTNPLPTLTYSVTVTSDMNSPIAAEHTVYIFLFCGKKSLL